MGEESCRGGGISSEKKTVNSAGMSSTCSEEDNESACAPSPEEDPEEELEYGPGIVSKLRTRFLSITLKQQNHGLLRSNMRRSCSLEDLLDQGRSGQGSQGNCGHRNKGCEPPWSNLKRAKSMDSLLLSAEDRVDRTLQDDHASQGLSRDETREIIDSLTSNNHHHLPKLVKRKDGGLNRSTISICDEELPKPDTVKIYKRMFEPADAKRGMSHSNVRRKPPVLRASAKVGTATATKLPVHQKKVLNGELSPSEIKKSCDNNKEGGVDPQARSKLGSKGKTQVNGLEQPVGAVKNGQAENQGEGKKQPDSSKCRPAGKKVLSPPIKEEEEDAVISATHDLSSKRNEPVARYRVRTTKRSFETGPKPSVPPNKPVQGSKKKLHSTDRKVSLKKQAPEVPKLVETVQVVHKGGSDLRETEPSQIKREAAVVVVDCDTDAQPKQDVSLENNVPNGLVNPPLTNGYISELEGSPEPPTVVDNNSVRVESARDTETAAPSEVHRENKTILKEPTSSPGGNPTPGANKTTPLWQQKPPKGGGCGNSMVFDFRGKDVIHHLSVQPVPFGNKALRTRSLLIDGKEAIPYTNGSVNGGAGVRNGTALNDDEDEEYEMDYSYPPPSGVTFEGENVVIGRGSILTIRNKSLKIQFDDDVNDTFMYPSETSLLEECESLTTTNGSEAESDATEDDGGNDENDFSNGRPPKLRANTTIGITGGLATYTPSVLRTVDNFEPGMFRHNEILFDGDKSKHESPVQNGVGVGNDGEEGMLKPADPELISSWSLSTTTSDLLF